jgi:hypothetical protein
MPGLDDYAAQSSEGLVILFTDEQSPRLANRLLAAGLAEHGLGIAVIPGRSLNTDSPDQLQNISLQVNNLLRETGLGGHQVLYAGTSTTAGALLRLTAKSASLPQPRGILLLEPDLMRLDPSEFAVINLLQRKPGFP